MNFRKVAGTLDSSDQNMRQGMCLNMHLRMSPGAAVHFVKNGRVLVVDLWIVVGLCGHGDPALDWTMAGW